LTMEYNIIDVSGNENLVGKNRFYCNVDFNNRICEWLPFFRNNIKFDLIKDAQKEAKMKENILKEMEMKNTQKTFSQGNQNYDVGKGYND